MSKRAKVEMSVDDQLSDYLKTAEEALIKAVKLFADKDKLNRRVGYLTRLVRAQELVTGLFREELVRQRGPHRAKGAKSRK